MWAADARSRPACDGVVLHVQVAHDALDDGRDGDAVAWAAKGCDMPNFKGSYLGRFPLVSADFWTSDHLSERSRSVGAVLKRARAEHSR
ncbi:hypothetical protein SO694_0021500 [Aureococcus anophagefferens]|uniref:Uncharacterized protein n=1 Tax=Aureococcus anophagefferens TaxID=44056 RepID=A0ABR1FFZ9_AURAN